MATREVKIAAPEGLHARPASNFVQLAKSVGVKVTIQKGDGKAVPATSILQVLALGAGQGDVVTLAAEGEGAEEALDKLVAQLEKEEA